MIQYAAVASSAPPVDRPSIDWAAVSIVLLAVAFRLYRVDIPLVDGHSWRQVTNADIARHFTEGSLNLFVPRVSWGGLNGVVGMEFPLLQYVTGLLWLLTGESHVVARLVSIVFSISAVIAIYFLGTRLFGRPAGRASAFLLAVSPGAVYFGRAFMSDTPMLAFMIGAVLAWDRYFDRPTTARTWAAAVLTALAALVKLPAILVLAPIAGLAWSRHGWSGLWDRALVAGCGAAVATVVAWYWYADWIYLHTGLTQAVFRPSGTYPQDLAPGVVYTSVSHFATLERLTDGAFWWEMVLRFWRLHLMPIGFLGAVLAPFFAWRSRRRAVIGLWTLAGAMLLVVSAEGQWVHEFHQLPFLPPLALAFGVTAAPLFDGVFLSRFAPRKLAVGIIGVALVVVAIFGFLESDVLPNLYRVKPGGPAAAHFLKFGSVVQAAIPPDALLVTVDYAEFGANSPMLLYYARRQGWSFDISSISPYVIENLRARHGARYFVSSDRRELESTRVAVMDYLAGFERVDTPGRLPDLLIVNLQRPVR